MASHDAHRFRFAAKQESRSARSSRPAPTATGSSASTLVSRRNEIDGIHMTEPYHRLMAKEWLKYLAGARPQSPSTP